MAELCIPAMWLGVAWGEIVGDQHLVLYSSWGRSTFCVFRRVLLTQEVSYEFSRLQRR